MKKFAVILFLILIFSMSLQAQTVATPDQDAGPKASSLRIAVQGGLFSRIGKLPSDAEGLMLDHISRLRSGVSYGADATYFFLEFLGAGVKFQGLNVNCKQPAMIEYSSGAITEGEIEDRIFMCFLGPIVTGRLVTADKRHAFYLSDGVGYMGFRDAANLGESYVLKGNTLGLMSEIGYDLGITKHFGVGASVALYLGTLTKGTVTDRFGYSQPITLDKDHYESLSRFEVSLGMRFNF